ncbi:MAG: polysaccharide biosynthesis protein PslG [Solirubrobacteraceae bacterium]|jgi:hypothetical protein|nr:polysaccharide biosynthesis protein PslG [Solirubrobacteraceae bacterium]
MKFLSFPRLAVPLLLLAALLLPAPAGASTPASFFGVMGDGPLLAGRGDLDAQTALMHAVGVRSMRVAIYWDSVQPYATPADVPESDQARFIVRDGVPIDLFAYDVLVLAAAKAHIRVLPVVQRSPTWAAADPNAAASSPPRRAADFTAFLKVLVERYGPDGSVWAEHPEVPPLPIRSWQIWNEPDITKYWAVKDWAPAYVHLLSASDRALKQADPRSKTVAAGLTNQSWLDLRKLYAAGARSFFDVAAIHPFSRRVSNVVRLVRLARTEMRKAGDARKPVMLTEVSWSSGQGESQYNYGWETTEAGQAERIRALLPKLAAQRVSLRIAGLYWYTWLSRPVGGLDSFDYSGLRRVGPDGKVVDKPALTAFAQTVHRLTG